MSASQYKDYLKKGLCERMDIHYENCSENWDKSFATTAKLFGKLNNNLAVEYVESWNPEESQRMGYEKLFQTGIDNARKAFPGHSFIVVPQVSKNGNFHNHVLFCTVSDKGDRIYSDFKHRHIWHKTCDAKSRSLGLSTVNRKNSKLRERLSHGSHMAQRRGLVPYQLQIMQKADFARRIATSIDEFISFMGILGVQVDVRGETMTYRHPARKKGTRDRKLGLNYHKEGLNEQFKKNEREFKARPRLKQFLTTELTNLFDERGNLIGNKTQFPFHPGGHQKFERNSQLAGAHSKEHENQKGTYGVEKKDSPTQVNWHSDDRLGDLADFISSSISQASQASIPGYCDQNGIKLIPNEDGSYRLKGREHILITKTQWVNTKTKNGRPIGTRGSLIEFVANHKGLSVLESIAHINDNKRLLSLQSILGKQERPYREFYVPKNKELPEKESIGLIRSLAKHLGYKSDFAKAIYRMRNVKATTERTVRFIFGDKAYGATEYKMSSESSWTKKNMGFLRSGVLKQQGSSSKVKLFKDPFVFMETTKGRGVMNYKSSDNLLVLGDEELTPLDLFLANNQHIKHIEFFGFNSRNLNKNKQLELKRNGITFNFIESQGKSKEKNKGLDISL